MRGGPGRMREDRGGCGEDRGGCGEDRGGCGEDPGGCSALQVCAQTPRSILAHLGYQSGPSRYEFAPLCTAQPCGEDSALQTVEKRRCRKRGGGGGLCEAFMARPPLPCARAGRSTCSCRVARSLWRGTTVPHRKPPCICKGLPLCKGRGPETTGPDQGRPSGSTPVPPHLRRTLRMTPSHTD